MSYRNRTGIWLDYEFEYKGKKESFSYEIPQAEIVCNGIRAMFAWHDVNVDAKDSDLVNCCYALGVEFEDNEQFIEFCKKACEEDAREEFNEEKALDEE